MHGGTAFGREDVIPLRGLPPHMQALGDHMNPEELFRQAVSSYPVEISLANCEHFPDGGARVPELTAAHDALEENYSNECEELQAMHWSVYQALHLWARSRHLSGESNLLPGKLSWEIVAPLYDENLSSIKDSSRAVEAT